MTSLDDGPGTIRTIRLNVGGCHFETSKETLVQCSGYFRTMLSGKFGDWHEGTSSEIFIDRDGSHFAHLLNYLRDPRSLVPDGLIHEFEFFQIAPPAGYEGFQSAFNEPPLDDEKATRAQAELLREPPTYFRPAGHL